MAGIVELKAMLQDNHEASAILNDIEGTLSTNANKVIDLEQRLGTAGNDLTEAIQSRDKIKGVVKNQLGIEEFTEDAIKMKLSSYGNEDAIAARDKQFNELKASSASAIEALEAKITAGSTEMNGMRLKLAISKTDVMGQTRGDHANEMLLQWIAQDAVFDDNGNIMYKGKGGETLTNSNHNPLTLEDRINEIKGDQSRDFVFQERFLKGGGAPTEKTITGPAGNASGGAFVRSKMNFNEQKSYRDKYGESAYAKLPLA